jgi:hypothetical protein
MFYDPTNERNIPFNAMDNEDTKGSSVQGGIKSKMDMEAQEAYDTMTAARDEL